MKKIEKKLSKEEKGLLRFLIERFLEREGPDILEEVGEDHGRARKLWDKLHAILSKNSIWLDEVDEDELVDTDFRKLLLEYHGFLKPIWNQFREALFDYKYRVVPDRVKDEALRKSMDKLEGPLSEYKELLEQESIIHWEQFYEIKTTVSFDPGHVTFYKRSINLLKNFLDLLYKVPNSYFLRCENCEKCIVLTRSDKRFCRGCASKKKQKDKWRQDPEGMREAEKKRYREKRKGKK